MLISDYSSLSTKSIEVLSDSDTF